MTDKSDHKHGTGKHYVAGCEDCKVLNRAARARSRRDPVAQAKEAVRDKRYRSTPEFKAKAAKRQRTRRKDPEQRLRDNASAVASQAARRDRLRLRSPEQADSDFIKLHPDGKKECRKCHERLPKEAFARNRCVSSGRAQECLPCARIRADRWFTTRFTESCESRGIDPWECIYCEIPLGTDTREFDHFVPVSAGGPDDFDNLVPACFPCNRGVGGKFETDPWVWIKANFPHRLGRIRSYMPE